MLVSKNNKNLGFVLIDSLLIIALIGLLITAIALSIKKTQQNKRDAQRISDLQQISTALDIYYDREQIFPEESKWTCVGDSKLDHLITSGIMIALPDDPLNEERTAISTGCYNYKSDGRDYKLRANLENKKAVMEEDVGRYPMWYEIYTENFKNE